MATVLVTGGTGQLGKVLIPKLQQAGHRVRLASRQTRPDGTDAAAWATVDWTRPETFDEALTGVDSVVHTASGTPKGERETMPVLVAAALRQPTAPHVLHVSIVGIDLIPMPLYRAKLDAEKALTESGLPFTIQRATQFHPFLAMLLGGISRLPLVVLLPRGLRFQPISLESVADRLVELVAAGPQGRVTDIGGPAVRPLPDLARAFVSATGRSRRIVEVPLPGKLLTALRSGAGTTPEHAAPGETFEEFLSRHVRPGAAHSDR